MMVNKKCKIFPFLFLILLFNCFIKLKLTQYKISVCLCSKKLLHAFKEAFKKNIYKLTSTNVLTIVQVKPCLTFFYIYNMCYCQIIWKIKRKFSQN